MSEKTYLGGESYAYPLIIKKLLNTPLIYAPDQEIVYRDESRYTYRTLNERIGRLANALTKTGVGSGDTVAVFDYDSHRYLECFFAIPMMGAVLQTVNWRLSADQIVYTINHAEAKVIIIHADFFPILAEIQDQLETVQTVIVISTGGAVPDFKYPVAGDYENLLASAAVSYDFPDLDENTRATTFYTTGTTGLPKGVYYSHRQLVLHTFSVAVALGSYNTIGRFRSNDVYMPITPMFHVHAWGLPYVATLLGAKQVYPGKYEPEMLLKLVDREKVTFSHCVPTILQMIVSSPTAQKIDLTKWKVMIGGSRLTKALAQSARKIGITVFTGYGMSETCPVISIGVPKPDLPEMEDEVMADIVTRTGLPIPLAEIQVVDAGDKPLPHDGASSGEVVLRSPWLTKSYAKAPDKTEELWRNGWLHTGDVGHVEDGYLQITDRIKDVIKSGGEWVSSLDLENMIGQHEAVLESAAIGIPDEKWGERPLIFVVLKPGYERQVGSADFKVHMQSFAGQGQLPKYGVPDRYEIVDQIAKTSIGKINKKWLREQYIQTR
ncbi:MAG: fatty acid--CoA ligase [Deltaproteobacteria bacterium]